MRKFFITLKSRISEIKIKYLNKRKIQLQKQIIKVDAEINKILLPSIKFAIDVVYGIKSNPPKEKKFKTLCPSCYRYFFIEPSKEMLSGKNIAYNNCPHCNSELVSFASYNLETGKNAITWLKSEYKKNVEGLREFLKDFSAKNGIQFSEKGNNIEKLEAFYKRFLGYDNTNGIFN